MWSSERCILLYVSFSFYTSVEPFPGNLHNLMTETELVHYFQTSNNDNLPDYEIVYLPLVFPLREAVGEFGQTEEIDYSFSAFETPVNLRLRENEHIVSPHFKVYLQSEGGTTELENTVSKCHYLHGDHKSVAAVSLCQPNSVQALVFLENSTLEVLPLNGRLQSLLRVREAMVEDQVRDTSNEKVPHLVKRATNIHSKFHDGSLPIAGSIIRNNTHLSNFEEYHTDFNGNNVEAVKIKYGANGRLTLELAMFFDEPAYHIFAPYMDYDKRQLQDMLLAYINGVQALYHHPSLGVPMDIVLVRLDIFRSQPKDMPHHNGERGNLLDSFCEYQKTINPSQDADPNHWDMALYVSGLDFYSYENGRKSGVTMGLATVGGVCLDQYACVIVEMGTTNVFGKPYPSAGFTSVYIAAHEIGHNLGMHHDGNGNHCSKEGYIMSASRGTNGETQWSSCSAEVMAQLGWAKCLQDTGKSSKHLDHNRFLENPGQVYTAKKQCEILLRDKDAVASPNQQLSTICYNLQCKTPHRSGYYLAGPALEGTSCGRGMYCAGGNCLVKELPKPGQVTPGGWSEWQPEPCNSGCIEKSLGFQISRRHCNNPTPVNSDAGCDGSSVSSTFCNDQQICSKGRTTVVDYASQKCKEFSRLIPELDPKGAGLQAPHEEGRLWMGCAIFCRRGDSGTFYTPRVELNDLGVSPYFPDGTWCHSENGINFYCLRHHCLPENFPITKSSALNDTDDPFSQNAHPLSIIPAELRKYLSLTPDGKPLLTYLKPEDVIPKEEDWEIDDYVELPEAYNRNAMKYRGDENTNLNSLYQHVAAADPNTSSDIRK